MSFLTKIQAATPTVPLTFEAFTALLLNVMTKAGVNLPQEKSLRTTFDEFQSELKSMPKYGNRSQIFQDTASLIKEALLNLGYVDSDADKISLSWKKLSDPDVEGVSLGQLVKKQTVTMTRSNVTLYYQGEVTVCAEIDKVKLAEYMRKTGETAAQVKKKVSSLFKQTHFFFTGNGELSTTVDLYDFLKIILKDENGNVISNLAEIGIHLWSLEEIADNSFEPEVEFA